MVFSLPIFGVEKLPTHHRFYHGWSLLSMCFVIDYDFCYQYIYIYISKAITVKYRYMLISKPLY